MRAGIDPDHSYLDTMRDPWRTTSTLLFAALARRANAYQDVELTLPSIPVFKFFKSRQKIIIWTPFSWAELTINRTLKERIEKLPSDS